VVVENDGPADWNEDEMRRERAAEAEEIIAAEQPARCSIPRKAMTTRLTNRKLNRSSWPAPRARRRWCSRFAAQVPAHTPEGRDRDYPAAVSHRGKRVPVERQLCRLRDIQDIFMGTAGAGELRHHRAGTDRALLSSKPNDRRAIIEEAAGITRFKNKKRLAELRLESAKQNLSRVDDIFEEVTRQMNSLKRQAAKAERFAAVRDELRGRLRVVLASRMALMDAEQAGLEKEIAALTERINDRLLRSRRRKQASTHSPNAAMSWSRRPRGAEPCQRSVCRAGACHCAERSNTERVGELETRIAAAGAELEQTRTQLAGIAEERAQQHAFLETAAGEAKTFRQQVEARQLEARTAAEEVFTAERQLESSRRHAMHLLTLAGNARNHTAQGEESLAALEREAERLQAEMSQARNEQENLGVESGQARARFESAAETLKLLEAEIAGLREACNLVVLKRTRCARVSTNCAASRLPWRSA